MSLKELPWFLLSVFGLVMFIIGGLGLRPDQPEYWYAIIGLVLYVFGAIVLCSQGATEMNHRQKLAYWKRIYKARKLQKGECDACWLLLFVIVLLASIALALVDADVFVL